MLRRIGTLAAAAFVATALVSVIPSPASANSNGTCTGQGTATTGTLYYPGAGPTTPEVPPTPDTVGYAFTLEVGACVYVGVPPTTEFTLSASGTLTGWCGQSSGTGTTANGHAYSHVSAGSFLVLTGEAVGVVNAVPDATAGQSCATGATRFLVTGSVELVEL